jgi:outer membrane protein
MLHQGAAIAADLPKPAVLPPAPSFLSGFYIHAGPGGLILSESAKISLGGSRVPGASIQADPQLTPVIEAGYYLNPNFAVSFTGGYPPTVDVMGKGLVAGLGRMGTMTYGPATLTAHYHFTGFGPIQPYIGAGPTFMYVFNASNGALSNFQVSNAIGFAGQVGVDIMINDNWGAFIDVKKAYLRTTSTGTLGGIPTKSKAVLDPLVIHTGVSYRF